MRRSTIPQAFGRCRGSGSTTRRMPTEWGNILHTHLSNFRYRGREPRLRRTSCCSPARASSSDPGVGDVIAQPRLRGGPSETTSKPDWEWRAKSEDDPIFQAIKVRDSGALGGPRQPIRGHLLSARGSSARMADDCRAALALYAGPHQGPRRGLPAHGRQCLGGAQRGKPDHPEEAPDQAPGLRAPARGHDPQRRCRRLPELVVRPGT